MKNLPEFVPMWQRKVIVLHNRSITNQKKTPVNPRHKPRAKMNSYTVEHPLGTNHFSHQARAAKREEAERLLRELVRATKERHPGERMSYRAWKILATQETSQYLSQQ